MNTTNRLAAYLVSNLGSVLGTGKKVHPGPLNTTQVTARAQPQSLEPHNRISSSLAAWKFLKNSTSDQEGIPSFEGLWISLMGVFGWFWYFKPLKMPRDAFRRRLGTTSYSLQFFVLPRVLLWSSLTCTGFPSAFQDCI